MKKLTNADLKWLEKFVPNADLKNEEKTDKCESIFGETVNVTPTVGKIIDVVFCIYNNLNNPIGLYRIHSDLKTSNGVQNFNRGKYIVLKLDQNAYMKLKLDIYKKQR